MQMAIMYKNRLLCIITNYVNEPSHIYIYVNQIYAVMFPRESSFSLELIITCDRFCELIKIAYVNITFYNK